MVRALPVLHQELAAPPSRLPQGRHLPFAPSAMSRGIRGLINIQLAVRALLFWESTLGLQMSEPHYQFRLQHEAPGGLLRRHRGSMVEARAATASSLEIVQFHPSSDQSDLSQCAELAAATESKSSFPSALGTGTASGMGCSFEP